VTAARVVVCLSLAAAIGCGGAAPSETAAAGAAPVERPPASAASPTHLRIQGTGFTGADGTPFQWRGITALRLLDHLADGKQADVEAFLAWCASRQLTVVRTLAMGGDWLNLKPEEGRAAVSRLLVLARKHGLHVEVVGLATTIDMPVNMDEHIAALGAVLEEHANALLELANEPVHPSQAPAIGKPSVLKALAARVPADVPVSLGSVEGDEGFAQGDYVTWHAPRASSEDGWGWVLRLPQGAELIAKFGKPVISDEPIGAAAAFEPGRRDNVPARFRAAGLLTRLVGMGSTFHYNGGLEAAIPDGVELACFDAWNEAWTLLPDDVERTGTFRAAGVDGAAVRGYKTGAVRGVFERTGGDSGWVLSVGAGEPGLTLAEGWRVAETKSFDGGRLLRLTRGGGA
jgi:hypothetical protein